jgi:hypothetical protein
MRPTQLYRCDERFRCSNFSCIYRKPFSPDTKLVDSREQDWDGSPLKEDFCEFKGRTVHFAKTTV